MKRGGGGKGEKCDSKRNRTEEVNVVYFVPKTREKKGQPGVSQTKVTGCVKEDDDEEEGRGKREGVKVRLIPRRASSSEGLGGLPSAVVRTSVGRPKNEYVLTRLPD